MNQINNSFNNMNNFNANLNNMNQINIQNFNMNSNSQQNNMNNNFMKQNILNNNSINQINMFNNNINNFNMNIQNLNIEDNINNGFRTQIIISKNNNLFNSNNNINNLNQNIMNGPFKPIINNYQSFYINAVLISLGNLNYINKYIKDLCSKNNILQNNFNMTITKDIYNLFSALYNNQSTNCSNLISDYNKKIKKAYKGETMKKDPYHFLLYLMDMLHKENNEPENSNYDKNKIININIQLKSDNNFMYNLMSDYYNQTHNSFIFNGFYYMIKDVFECNNCPTTYNYAYENIFKFDVDQYKNYKNELNISENFNLGQCFDCFTGGNLTQCKNCGNFKGILYKSLISTSNVLIIALIRKNHMYTCDINFPENLDIKDYYEQNQKMNNLYILKACVSLNYQGYFADINLNNNWFRYFGNQDPIQITKDNIYNYEPQLLFYELSENNH